uniref:Uncharacterized protein n=1 Tax=Oryza meridionalis TaxID=40149 RepID=A0A0E0F7C0_9ORYZ
MFMALWSESLWACGLGCFLEAAGFAVAGCCGLPLLLLLLHLQMLSRLSRLARQHGRGVLSLSSDELEASAAVEAFLLPSFGDLGRVVGSCRENGAETVDLAAKTHPMVKKYNLEVCWHLICMSVKATKQQDLHEDSGCASC